LVDKIGETKPPVDDHCRRRSTRRKISGRDRGCSAPDAAKPEEKPVEKKPDPPKPVVENKPKEVAEARREKPDQAKVDPIAEALKDQRRRPEKKPAAQAASRRHAAGAAKQQPKERTFDPQRSPPARQARSPRANPSTGDQRCQTAAALVHGRAGADN
jgi:outer membrane biosynthesis protein TonB